MPITIDLKAEVIKGLFIQRLLGANDVAGAMLGIMRNK